MKYDHMVKVNGKFYKAGDEVPEQASGASKEDDTQKFINKVKRMSKPDLISSAKDLEIEMEETLNAEAMKELIIAKINENAATE